LRKVKGDDLSVRRRVESKVKGRPPFSRPDFHQALRLEVADEAGKDD
jgi:hypothetical protein